MSLRGFWLGGFAEGLAQFGHHFFSVSGQLFHLLHASTYYCDISNSSKGNLECYLRGSDLLFSLPNERIYPSRVKSGHDVKSYTFQQLLTFEYTVAGRPI